MKGFPHCRMVEIKLPAANNTVSTFKFQDQPDLRYARILAIETYVALDIAQTFPSGFPLIDGTQISKLSLVLETNDADDVAWTDAKGKIVAPRTALGNGRFTSTQQNIKYLPLASLHRIQNSATAPFVRQLMEFDNMYVSWDKCFIQTINGGLGNSTDVGVALMVYYSWLDINGKPIART